MSWQQKTAHPNAKFAAHPECRSEVLKHADFIGSTAEIIGFTRETDSEEILIGTEMGIVERLQRELPDKKIYSVAAAFVCPNMKKVTLDSVLYCLENEKFEIELTPDEIEAAKKKSRPDG